MKTIKVGAGVLTGLFLAGAGAGAATPPALYTAAQATAGATVFTQHCAICHGAQMQGGTGPTLLGQAFSSPANHDAIAAIFGEIAEQMPAGSTALDYNASLTSTVPLVSQVKQNS